MTLVPVHTFPLTSRKVLLRMWNWAASAELINIINRSVKFHINVPIRLNHTMDNPFHVAYLSGELNKYQCDVKANTFMYAENDSCNRNQRVSSVC